ncbi:MAG: septum formation initiator family protein [Anaerolineaceae bacterium]
MKKILTNLRSILKVDKRLLLVVVLAVLVVMMMDFNSRMSVMLQLDQQESQLKTQKIELQQTKVKLEAEIVYANSDRALEEWAREEARLINDGDIPIIILPGGTLKNTPTPPSEPKMAAMNTWEVWKELFFGNRD